MKILQIFNRVPWPPKDGGAIAMLNMANGFQKLSVDLQIAALNTNKHYISPENLPGSFPGNGKPLIVNINTDVKPFAAVRNLFSDKSYNVERFYSPAFAEKLRDVLRENKFDIIQFEGLHITRYFDVVRQFSKAPIILRAHNVEHIIWERLAQAGKYGLKKSYLSLLARRIKKYESDIIKRLDGIIAITENDKEIFEMAGCSCPVYVAPTGIDLDKYIIDNLTVEWPSVFHLGALDWLPNQQAADWFLGEIWPKVYAKHPEVKFYLAGRYMPERFRQLKQDGLVVVGEVADGMRFTNSKAIMVVPLLSGSGMRIKIIEGMALGKTIVSTSVGAEGIECTNEKDILIADSAEAFVEALSSVISDKKQAGILGENARQLVAEKYNNEKIVKGVLDWFEAEF